MTALVLAALAALFGASVAEMAPTARPWLLAVVGAVMAFQAGVLQPLVGGRPRVALRLVVLIAGVKALQLVAGRPTGVDAEFALGVAVGITAWVTAAGTRSDVDAIDRGIDIADGLTPLQRIRMRATVLGTVAVVAAAWGVVGLGGAVDVRRPAAARMSIAPLAFFGVAILAIGFVARRAELRRWARDGARVDSTVGGRWSRAVVAVAVVGLAAGWLLPVLARGVTAAPVRGLAASGTVGDWVADRMLALGEALDTEGEPGAGGDIGSVTAPEFEPVEPAAPWVGDVALLALFAAIFASVIARARNRRRRSVGSEEPGLAIFDILAAVWKELVDIARSIVAFLARWVRRMRRASDDLAGRTPPIPTDSSAPWGWRPSDPVRLRIAEAYRKAVGRVVGSHQPAGRSETPRELAGRVRIASFWAVTGLFEEARYSDHVMSETQADVAERAADGLSSDV